MSLTAPQTGSGKVLNLWMDSSAFLRRPSGRRALHVHEDVDFSSQALLVFSRVIWNATASRRKLSQRREETPLWAVVSWLVALHFGESTSCRQSTTTTADGYMAAISDDDDDYSEALPFPSEADPGRIDQCQSLLRPWERRPVENSKPN